MKRTLLLCLFLLLIPLTANAQKTLQDAVTGTATGETLPIGSSTTNGVLAQITGTFSGTITWRATFNGTDYVDVQATNLTTGVTATTATAAGLYSILAPRIVAFRAPVTTYASGTITVTAAAANGVARMGGGVSPSGTMTANDVIIGGGGSIIAASGVQISNVATLTGAQAFTNKTLTDSSNHISGTVIDSGTVADGRIASALTGKTYNGLTVTSNGTNTLNIAAGKALTVSDNVTVASDGTGTRTLNVGPGGTLTALAFTSPGTGVATALGVNVGSAGAVVVNGGALGTPSSAGTLPAFTLGGTVSGGGQQLNNVIIGTTTPLAGSFTTVTATSINGNTFTTGTYTLTGTAGKTLNFTNSLTLSGTDSTTHTFPSTSATIARTDAGQTFTGTQVIGGMSFAATNSITGGAGNMTITSGTGNSRTMALQTTTSGGVATTAMTLDASQNATFAAQVSATGKIVGGTGLQSSNNNAAIYLGFNATNTVDLPSTVVIGVSSDATFFGTRDTYLTRRGAANWNLGNSANGTPVANTLTIGESSRGGTDSNVAGASGTIQSGTGTGTGTVATLIFQTPTLGSSGTTAQSYATRLTLDSTNATFTGNVVTPTVNATTSLKINGNALFLSTTPTISSGFGVTPSIAGIASVFKVTVGTGGDTSGVVAFNGTFANAPACMANDETSNVLVRAVSTTTGVTISGVMAGGDIVKIICAGY